LSTPLVSIKRTTHVDITSAAWRGALSQTILTTAEYTRVNALSVLLDTSIQGMVIQEHDTEEPIVPLDRTQSTTFRCMNSITIETGDMVMAVVMAVVMVTTESTNRNGGGQREAKEVLHSGDHAKERPNVTQRPN
jgi:hypothetical protein